MQPSASHPLGGGGVGFASIWTEMHEGQYSNDLLTILVMLTVDPLQQSRRGYGVKKNTQKTPQQKQFLVHNVMLLF